MRTRTLALLVIGLGGAATVGGLLYRRGIDDLVFNVDGFQFAKDGTLQMRIRVTNPSRFFGYPVPQFNLTAFDSMGTNVGTIVNNVVQYVAPGGDSFIYGTASPNYANIASVAAYALTSQSATPGVTFSGMAFVGPLQIPVTITT